MDLKRKAAASQESVQTAAVQNLKRRKKKRRSKLKEIRQYNLELFKIKGIPIRINVTWLILFFLLIFSLLNGELKSIHPEGGTLAWFMESIFFVLFFFSSLIAHEAAHSIVAKSKSIDVSDITLYIFGGAARILKEPAKPFDEIQMAAAGPLVSFIISGFSYLLSIIFLKLHFDSGEVVFLLLSYANLILAVFNLIPAFPLDGGRILRSIIWLFTKNRLKATSAAAIISKFFALLLFSAGVYLSTKVSIDSLWISFIAIVMFIFSSRSLEAAYQSELLEKKICEVFLPEEILAIAIPQPHEIDYETTAVLKCSDTVYSALKLLRKGEIYLVRFVFDDEIVYFRASDLYSYLVYVVENSRKFLDRLK